MLGVVEGLGVNINSFTLDLVRPATIVPDAVGDGGDVTPGHCDRLSIVKRFYSG